MKSNTLQYVMSPNALTNSLLGALVSPFLAIPFTGCATTCFITSKGATRFYLPTSVNVSRKHHQSLNTLPHALTYCMCSMISLVCLSQIFPMTNSSSNDLLYPLLIYIFFTRAYVSIYKKRCCFLKNRYYALHKVNE